MDKYISIKTKADIDTFIEKTNALRDGYIISVKYKNSAIKVSDDTYEFNSELKQLKIRVLIISIDTVLEMVFENIFEWKITDTDYGIFGTDIVFDEIGDIIWADDVIDLDIVEENNSYVIAKKMKWRTL